MKVQRVAFDFETTGLNPWYGHRPFLLGLENEDGKVILAWKGTRQYDKALRILAEPSIEKIGWNAKFDIKMARADGGAVRGIVHDAMLLCFMNNEYEENLKLKDVARRHLGESGNEEKEVKSYLIKLKRQTKKEVNYSQVPRQLMNKYLEKDLDDTIRLFWKFENIITGPQKRVYEIERELIPNIVRMEEWGVHVDVAYCKNKMAIVGPKIRAAEAAVHDAASIKFNLNSGKQLTQILESFDIDTGDRNKDGSMKMDTNYLHPFKDHPVVKQILEYRSLKKVGVTYFESFLEHQIDGIIHPSFWPFGQEHGVKTGRFSCSDPNFQNVPGGGRGENTEMLRDPGLVRRAITPRPGYAFVFLDYKQIEFVVFACEVGDRGLLAELRRGVDFHTANAYRIFGRNCFDGKTKEEIKSIRFQAKTLNFAFIFGMGVAHYAHIAGLTLQEARARKTKFFNEVPAARDFLLRSQANLLRDGYVQDTFGRRYHVPRDLCYKAANALCQGPSALVMKRGINRTYKALSGLDAHPFLTVHDELGIEVKLNEVYDCVNVAVDAMEDHENFAVPIRVDVAVTDTNWADKKNWQEVKHKWKALRRRN